MVYNFLMPMSQPTPLRPRPAAVMPLHDPQLITLRPLINVEDALRNLFGQVVLGVSTETAAAAPDVIAALRGDDFWRLIDLDASQPIGAQLMDLYGFAAGSCPPEKTLHLCFPDRLAFALSTGYAQTMADDVDYAGRIGKPVLFQRSPLAWASHPSNYCEVETFITDMGEQLFGKRLDFAWCHLALPCRDLQRLLPLITSDQFDVLTRLVLHLMPAIIPVFVDWLAWEDPFLLGVDADELREQRENDPQETVKRLGYALPMLRTLLEVHSRQQEGK